MYDILHDNRQKISDPCWIPWSITFDELSEENHPTHIMHPIVPYNNANEKSLQLFGDKSKNTIFLDLIPYDQRLKICIEKQVSSIFLQYYFLPVSKKIRKILRGFSAIAVTDRQTYRLTDKPYYMGPPPRGSKNI